jgi:cyanophycinase-like exopeptidase
MIGAGAERRPIVLLADSQLLFWRDAEGYFVQRIARLCGSAAPRVAYVGASNGDDVVFFDLFRAAMSPIETTDCALVNSCFSSNERKAIANADIILLAGGDVERGWRIFEAVGLRDAIVDRYLAGALLVGVSAGAVQLGAGCYVTEGSNGFLETFKLVPFVIGAHEEREEWRSLVRAVHRPNSIYRGLGLPSGGGAIYHVDGSLEPLRRAVVEISVTADVVRTAELVPERTTH